MKRWIASALALLILGVSCATDQVTPTQVTPTSTVTKLSAKAGPHAYIKFENTCMFPAYTESPAILAALAIAFAPKLIDLAISGIDKLFKSEKEGYAPSTTALGATELWKESANGMEPSFACLAYVIGKTAQTEQSTKEFTAWADDKFTADGLAHLGLADQPQLVIELKLIMSKDGGSFRFVPTFVYMQKTIAKKGDITKRDLLITGILEGSYVGDVGGAPAPTATPESKPAESGADAAAPPQKAPTPKTPGTTSGKAAQPAAASNGSNAPPKPTPAKTPVPSATTDTHRFGAFQIVISDMPVPGVLRTGDFNGVTTHWMPAPQAAAGLDKNGGKVPAGYVPISVLMNVQESQEAPLWLVETAGAFDSSKDDVSKALGTALVNAISPKATPTPTKK